MTNSVKACGYVRAVTEGPSTSSTVQRERIIEMAEKEGYEIVEWYTDEVVRDSRVNERPARSEMLADAPNAEWQIVLCHDLSRLGRRDATEPDAPQQMLRIAGKCLHTVAEGLFERRNTPGLVLQVIQREFAAAYTAKLSHVARQGKLNSFLNGRRPGGKCPYGYACQVTDPRGATHRVSREEDFSLATGWSKILVPGDPVEVEAVRWLFDTHAATDAGIAALAHQLNAREVPSPTGRAWQASTVAYILANDIYVGDTRFRRRSSGRFTDPQGERDEVVRHNTHEGLVAREVWDRVQAKLNRS